MEKLMSVDQVAEALGVPVGTIYRWNYLGTGPRALRVGKHCRYRPADVESWLEQQADQPDRRRAG